jgi:uncharacterized protein (TIGR03083 family)
MIATAPTQNQNMIQAISIPELSKAEAKQLALAEIQRCIDLLEQLSDDDWHQATDCAEWTVKDMTAHLAGACAGFASWSEFRRMYIFNPYMKKGEALIHGVNRCEVADRVDKTPQELIAEFRELGPKAIRTRQRIPAFIRAIRAPMEPLGVVSVRYLLDTIYTRDQWMHRADICRATGKQMQLTEEHDGRILDLVAADVAKKMDDILHGTVELTLTGTIERNYRFSTHAKPDTHISIDSLEFNRLSSARNTPWEAEQLSHITGDTALAKWFFQNCEVGY